MKIEYVEGWLLNEKNEVVRVWMDKDVLIVKETGVEVKVESVNVKNRTYEV